MSAQLEEHKQRVALGVTDGADALERFKAHYESDVVDRMEVRCILFGIVCPSDIYARSTPRSARHGL